MEYSMIPSFSPKKALLAVAVSFALSPISVMATCLPSPLSPNIVCDDVRIGVGLTTLPNNADYNSIKITITPGGSGYFDFNIDSVIVDHTAAAAAVELTNSSASNQALEFSAINSIIRSNNTGLLLDADNRVNLKLRGTDISAVTGVSAVAAGGDSALDFDSTSKIVADSGVLFNSTGGGAVVITQNSTIEANDKSRITNIGIQSTSDGDVVLNQGNNGSIDVGVDSTAVNLNTAGVGKNVTLTNAGTIIGGVNIGASGNTTLTNTSTMTGDLDIRSTGSSIVSNSSIFTGSFSLTGATTRFDNSGTWNIDSTQTSTLAGAGDFNNTGTIQWDTPANANLTLNLGANKFNNATASVINLTNGIAGDRFTINGSEFVGGGNLYFDVNYGDGSTPGSAHSDALDLTGITTAITGATTVHFTNIAGAPGGLADDPIAVVRYDLAITNPPSVTGDEFKVTSLDGKVYSPLGDGYDFYYHAGAASAPAGSLWAGIADPGWYLNLAPGARIITPVMGTHLVNFNASIDMFSFAMHDRIGEPRFTEGYHPETYNRLRAQSLWMRIKGGRTTSTMDNGSLDTRSYVGVTQIGGDVASWDNDMNRWHLGFFAGYGENHSKANSNKVTNSAKGEVMGYNMGLYGTWFEKKSTDTGFYADVWTQLSAYRNEVTGKDTTGSSLTHVYRSHQWTSSLESGYTFLPFDGEKTRFYIEPQGQIIYRKYTAKNHTDSNGLAVTGGRFDAYETRLGLRSYMNNKGVENGIQPFVTVNWYNSQKVKGLTFNNRKVSGGMPDNRVELKLGVQAEARRNIQLYGHVAQQWGSTETYRSFEGMVGVKSTF